MKVNGESLLTIALLLLLGALTVAGVLAGADAGEEIPLDSASTAPSGARALYEWLESRGYQVSDKVGQTFAIPEDAAVAFVLEPGGVTEPELAVIEAYVESGGTLVFAGESFGAAALLNHFEVRRSFALEPAENIRPVFPLFTNPPLDSPLPFTPTSYLEPDSDAYLPLAAVREGPVVISFSHGDGQVILSALTDPFTNAGLKETGAGAFVLNLIGGIPGGSQVWFDEWHHGRRPAARELAGPGDWLRSTPGGWAVLFSVFTLLLWTALSGRSFGRAERPRAHRERRAPLEYVTAIANLNQLAGNRGHLLSHYHRQLKRSLAARYRIDPGVPDDRFVETLQRYDPELDVDELSTLLAGLRDPAVSEAEMIERIRKAANR